MSNEPTATELERTHGSTLGPIDPSALPRRVIIESPLAGNVARNRRYALAALRDCLLRGEAPFASHVLYAQEGVLDDFDPHERRQGMRAGFSWIEISDATVVYKDLGISSGMRAGIARAKTAGHPIEFRSLPEWDLPENRPAPATPRPPSPYLHRAGHEGPGSAEGPRARPAAPARPAGMPRAAGARGAR